MSAAELRKAAETLRERAEAATSGPWTAILCAGGDACDGDHANGVWSKGAMDDVFRDEVGASTADANYIATMHPGVGLALADWLDATANEHDSSTGNSNVDAFFSAFDTASDLAALALARLINGGAS